ncbi:MAG: tetratricopeptide repeat protein [Cyclobacteriaceae bacterium]
MFLKHLDRVLTITLMFCALFSNAQDDAISKARELIEAQHYQAAQSLLDSLESAEGPSNMATVLHLKADVLYYQYELDQSVDYYLKAVSAYDLEEFPNYREMAACLSHAGFLNRELGHYEEAFSFYLRSLKMNQLLDDSVEVAIQHYNLGTLYIKAGMFEMALDNLNSAYQIDLARKDTGAIGFDLAALGDIQIVMEDYESALRNYKESFLMMTPANGTPNTRGIRLAKVGNTYLELNQLDSAEKYFSQSLNQLHSVNDSIRVALRWVDFARLYNKMGKFPEANVSGNKARAFFVERSLHGHLVSANMAMIETMIRIGLLDQAQTLVEENTDLSIQEGLLLDLLTTKNFALDIALSKKESSKVASLNTEIISLEDSLKRLDDLRAMKNLEIQYNIDKAKQINDDLQAEYLSLNQDFDAKSTQLKLAGIWVTIIIAILVTIVLILVMRYQKRRKALMAEIDQLRSQLKALVDKDIGSLGLAKEQIDAILDTPLSEREFEILNYAVTDLNNSEIAEKVFVSVNTVKYHLKNIYEKLGVSSRQEALKVALNAR